MLRIKILVIILTGLVYFSGFPPSFAQQKSSIEFHSMPWDQVLQTAKNKGKAIFLYAYTPGCRYCRQMERDIFPAEEVATYYNNTFISFKINIEDKGYGEDLAKKYDIKGFPSYLYFNSDGTLLHQSGSSKLAEEFIIDGKNALNPEKAIFSLKRRYDSGDKSALLLFNYSNALSFYHHPESQEEQVVSEYLSTQPPSQLTSEKNLTYIFTKHLSFKSASTQYFLKNQDKFIPLFGEAEVKEKAEKIITKTARLAGQANDTALLFEIKTTVTANFKDTRRLSDLARIYFFGGQQNWVKYAKSTLKFSETHTGKDWRTLHETATYINAFTEEKEALKIGAKIMQHVLVLNKSYDNLYLYAQLQHKAGRKDLALEAAKEAVKLANTSGDDSTDALAFIKEIK